MRVKIEYSTSESAELKIKPFPPKVKAQLGKSDSVVNLVAALKENSDLLGISDYTDEQLQTAVMAAVAGISTDENKANTLKISKKLKAIGRKLATVQKQARVAVSKDYPGLVKTVKGESSIFAE